MNNSAPTITTCLIGCDPAVTVRPISTNVLYSGNFLGHLRDWGDLHELRLLEGESILKLSRHLYEDNAFTWMGLYAEVEPYASSRKYSFLGAGFLILGDWGVDGSTAVEVLDRIVGAFLQKAAPDRKLLYPLSELTPDDLLESASMHALQECVFRRAPGSGLRPRADLSPGGVLFIDISHGSQIAESMELGQVDGRFSDYHTLLVGHAPKPDDDRILKKLEIVTLDAFSNGSRGAVTTERSTPPSTSTGRRRTIIASSAAWPAAQYATAGGGAQRDPYRRPDPHNPDRGSWDYLKGVVTGIVGTALFVVILTALWVLGAGSFLVDAADPSVAPSNGPPSSTSGGASGSDAAQNDSVADALLTVNRFFRLLFERKQEEANGLWSDTASRQDIREFSAWYSGFSSVAASVEQFESAAADAGGELRVHVAIDAVRRGEENVRGIALVTLRRGSGPQQWKIERVALQPPLT